MEKLNTLIRIVSSGILKGPNHMVRESFGIILETCTRALLRKDSRMASEKCIFRMETLLKVCGKAV